MLCSELHCHTFLFNPLFIYRRADGCGRGCRGRLDGGRAFLRRSTRNPKPETRNPKPEARNPKPETWNPKPETRNPKPEARNQKSEIRNPKPETRNPQPETRSSSELGTCKTNPHPYLFFLFFTLVTGPRRSLCLKLSDTKVCAPQIRAHTRRATGCRCRGARRSRRGGMTPPLCSRQSRARCASYCPRTESGPLRAVHLSRHKWPGGLVH